MPGPGRTLVFNILFLTFFRAAISTHDYHLERDEVIAIENVIKKLMECRDNPGLSLAIVKHGTMVWQKGYGKADLESDKPVTANTLFAIGSLTKAFTATLLAMLMEENKNITWNTPIKDILPDFKMPTQYMTDHVTLTDIIAHRTGLPRNDLIWVADEFTQEEIVRRLRYFTPKEPFRNKLVYTNTVYSIAGVVIKKLTGKSWEENIEERIFRPLGMRSSTFYDRGRANGWRQYAKPYGKDAPGDPLWPVDQNALSGCGPVGPATSISSTAKDMSRWLEFVTRSGEYNDTYQMISHQSSDKLFEAIAALNSRSHDGSAELPEMPVTRSMDTYSLGWTNGFYRGHRIYSHSGSMFGYESLITYIPDKSAAIYTNFNGPMGQGAVMSNLILHYFISDILLIKPHWLNAERACSYPLPFKDVLVNFTGVSHELPVDRSVPPERPLTDYVGRYGNYGFGNISVNVSEDNGLQLFYGRQGNFTLYPTGSKHRFSVEAQGHLSFLGDLSSKYSRNTWVEFKPGSSGVFTKVLVSMFNWMKPPVFERDLKFPPDTSPRIEQKNAASPILIDQQGCACALNAEECSSASLRAPSFVLAIAVTCISAFRRDIL